MTEYQLYKLICDHKHEQIALLDSDIKAASIAALKNKGLEITSSDNVLRPVLPVSYYDKAQILKKIHSKYTNEFDLQILYNIASTNSEIKQTKPTEKTQVLIAEYQSAGHGRRGNKWQSPLGSNLYLSVKFKHKFNTKFSLYPIYISIILADLLTEANINDVSIKWPNDIYINNKKCAGLLLESQFYGEERSIILGIGINILNNKNLQSLIPQSITSLSEHTTNESMLNKNYLLAALLNKIMSANKSFDSTSDKIIIKNFENYNCLKDKNLNIFENDKIHTGKYLRLNNDGALMAIIGNQEKKFYSADVSVRREANE